jgi:cytochrome c
MVTMSQKSSVPQAVKSVSQALMSDSPELNGLDGRKAGVVPNFNYSDANKNSGVVWNEENFKEYAKYPRAFVPGTKMIFPGLKDQQQVNDLWAYVKQFDASGNIKK